MGRVHACVEWSRRVKRGAARRNERGGAGRGSLGDEGDIEAEAALGEAGARGGVELHEEAERLRAAAAGSGHGRGPRISFGA
jgi:hypothetical protein